MPEFSLLWPPTGRTLPDRLSPPRTWGRRNTQAEFVGERPFRARLLFLLEFFFPLRQIHGMSHTLLRRVRRKTRGRETARCGTEVLAPVCSSQTGTLQGMHRLCPTSMVSSLTKLCCCGGMEEWQRCHWYMFVEHTDAMFTLRRPSEKSDRGQALQHG